MPKLSQANKDEGNQLKSLVELNEAAFGKRRTTENQEKVLAVTFLLYF